jgi:hypothetical protein
MTTLRDLVERLEQVDDELTLYAQGGSEATPESKAVAAREPEDGSLPADAHGMEYLLEVAEAQEVLEVWREWREGREPTPVERCEAIVYYARNDAYLPA